MQAFSGVFMFFQYPDKLTEVTFETADRSKLAVGFVSGDISMLPAAKPNAA